MGKSRLLACTCTWAPRACWAAVPAPARLPRQAVIRACGVQMRFAVAKRLGFGRP